MVNPTMGRPTELIKQYKLSHRIDPNRRFTPEEKDRYKDWLVRNGHHSQAPPVTGPEQGSNVIKTLTRLAPDWDRRRKVIQTRMKTLLRIYLSKWFWKGLEWQEVELVLLLIERLRLKHFPLNSMILSRWIGQMWLATQYLEESEKGVYNLGSVEMELEDLIPLLYSNQDFKAVWKLRSVQSLRDFLFVKVTGHEHEGKLGITRNRIRGYRDGKGKAGDPTRIKFSLEVDRFFFSEEYEKRWDELELEIARLTST